MGSKPNQEPDPDGFSWTTSSELQLLQVLINHKPAGINKHFQMAIIQDKFSSMVGCEITSDQIWTKLRTMYDLAAVDDREEVIPFPLEEKEFSLPGREFSTIMTEKQKEQKDRPPEVFTPKSVASIKSQKKSSNSSRTPTQAEAAKSTPTQDTLVESVKKLAATKEKDSKDSPKTSKPNEAVKAGVEKGTTKVEELSKSGAKRPERATRSTPTNTPAKRRKN